MVKPRPSTSNPSWLRHDPMRPFPQRLRAVLTSRNFRSAKLNGAILQFAPNLISPSNVSLPRWMSRTLCVFLCAAAPSIASGQNPALGDKQESLVQTQMTNVTFHFSKTVAVEIKSLNGVLVPLGKNEFPVFDDKNSYNL